VKLLFGAEEELQHDEEVIGKPDPGENQPTEASASATEEAHTKDGAESDAGAPSEQTEAEGLKAGSEGVPVTDSSTINTSDSSPEMSTPVLDQKAPEARNMPSEKQEL